MDEFHYAYTGPAEKDVCRLAKNKIEVEGDWTAPVYLELLKADGYGKNEDVTGDADFYVADEDILIIDDDGKILPKKAGKTLVTVIYKEKGYLAVVSVAPETLPVTDENIVVYYKFDEEDTHVVKDHSGKGSDGAYIRNTTWTEDIEGSAVQLSGGGRGSSTANYIELPNDFMGTMKVAGETEVVFTPEFADVGENDWFMEPVLWAKANKVANGYGDGTFGPNNNIVREQIAIMLHNYAVFKGYSTALNADLSAYKDADAVSSWAVPAMKWAVGSGIISGTKEGELKPLADASRAECAAMIMNFMEKFVE